MDEQTYKTAVAFFKDHALGPKMAPSCFMCGETVSFCAGRKHLELPGIVACQRCAAACDRAKTALNAPRATLESAAIAAALDLFGHSQSAALLLPIPNTNPPLYLACGEIGDIAALLESNRSYSFAANETGTASNISERLDSVPSQDTQGG